MKKLSAIILKTLKRKKNMKAFACIAAATTLLALAAPASAQFAKPEDAIKTVRVH